MPQPPEPPTGDLNSSTAGASSGSAGSSARAGRAVLALVVAASSLVVIDMTIVAIGLPDIRRDLGGSLADAQWVMVAYLITMGAVTQVMGSLSDAVGRRRVFLLGAALFTAASLACGLAPGVHVLVAARAVQGVGGAILMVNALPLLSHQFAGERRNMAISTWGSAATAVGLLAPLLGGVLVEWLSWRALFLVNLPVGLAILALGLRHLPADSPPPEPYAPSAGQAPCSSSPPSASPTSPCCAAPARAGPPPPPCSSRPPPSASSPSSSGASPARSRPCSTPPSSAPRPSPVPPSPSSCPGC